jgi:flagellar basal-body rod modification protein FlgD
MYNGEPYLVVGETILPLSTVISLNELAAHANTDDTENPNVPPEEAAA